MAVNKLAVSKRVVIIANCFLPIANFSHRLQNINKLLKKVYIVLVNWSVNVKFAPELILRGGAVVARWAHNPKVGGSNPPSATQKSLVAKAAGLFYVKQSV